MIKNTFKNHKKGQAVVVSVVMMTFIGLLISVGSSSPALREARLAREITGSKDSFITADAGHEDVAYRVRRAMFFDPEETLSLNGITATTTVSDNSETGFREVETVAENNDYFRKRRTEFTDGDFVTFNYAVQTGEGGFVMKNYSSIIGNLYANGPVTGSTQAIINGDVVSAGTDGLISSMITTGSAWAHNIEYSNIDGDALYGCAGCIIDSNVGGSLYPGSADLPELPLPISDETIQGWQDVAEAGGVIAATSCNNGTYNINTTILGQDLDIAIGPIKIECDVNINGGGTITLGGHVWIAGDLDVDGSGNIRINSSLGEESTAIVVDDPSDRLNRGVVDIMNTVSFSGSGAEGSYITLVSRNESIENGGTKQAISMKNSAQGDVILYSNHGGILLQNSVDVRSVTAYQVQLENTAELVYDSGLGSALFDTGPGGSWEQVSSKEVQ